MCRRCNAQGRDSHTHRRLCLRTPAFTTNRNIFQNKTKKQDKNKKHNDVKQPHNINKKQQRTGPTMVSGLCAASSAPKHSAVPCSSATESVAPCTFLFTKTILSHNLKEGDLVLCECALHSCAYSRHVQAQLGERWQLFARQMRPLVVTHNNFFLMFFDFVADSRFLVRIFATTDHTQNHTENDTA